MSPHINRVALSAAFVCICFGCLQLRVAHAEILTRFHASASTNAIADDKTKEAENTNSITHEKSATIQNTVNSDLIDKFSWKCANNASCLYSFINGIVESYNRGETVKLGLFDLVKLPLQAEKTKSKWNSSDTTTGRSISTFVDFISGNAIRIPVGPMVFSIQRADDEGDYIEVALLKKAVHQGRRGGDGGLFGGGGGGIRKRHQDKKQFQMLIPMYLAATTFGWTLVAAKAVALLTLKALIISKLAFIVAAMVLIKKFMDNASEKMMYQFPEHTPYMMPYGMDYPMHAMGGAEIATNEMYPAALQFAAAPLTHGHPGMEHLAAESNLHPHLADVHNSSQVLAALNAVGLGQKVKREDSWIAKGRPHVQWRRIPFLYRKSKLTLKSPQISKTTYPFSSVNLPFNDKDLALAAAETVAEEEAEESGEEDDIFNEEENVKDALQYLGLEIRKKKKK